MLEGEDGFAAAFADEYDPAPLATLGDPFEITRTYQKPYPCCRHLHAAIDACLAIRDAGLEPWAIERVEVGTYAIAARHDKAAVETILDAQMSMPHAVTTALFTGTDDRSAFSDPDVDADLASLRDRIVVTADPEMDARYPETRATCVVVETADGDRFEEAVDYPLGSPENPLSAERLESKFHDLTESRLSEEKRQRLLETVTDLSTLDDAQTIVDAVQP
ncbi:MmgE/PrpD family protein [Saliphagus sp. GCM10025308]